MSELKKIIPVEKKKLLVIEDKYKDVAERYFKKRNDIETMFAVDYEEALNKLPKADYVITDIFFPRKTGSGDKTLGKEAFINLVVSISEYAFINEEMVKSIMRSYKFTNKLPPKEHLECISERELINKSLIKLKEDIESSDESLQPLGILLADKLIKEKIPFEVATGFHHEVSHEAIFFYLRLLNAKIIEESHDEASDFRKSNEKFWENAYKHLISLYQSLK